MIDDDHRRVDDDAVLDVADGDGDVTMPDGDPADDAGGPDGTPRDGAPHDVTGGAGEVRRVATLDTSATSADDRVTTGVLAADASSRVELARRHRWLVGGGVLGVVVVLAYVLGSTLSADQAQEAARAEARADELAVGFARVVVERAESYEAPAMAVAVDGRALTAALEEHLTATERSPDELDELVRLTSASLVASADELDRLTGQPLPPLEGLVDPEAATAVLTELERLRVEAEALAAETRDAAADAVAWASAIRSVDAALAAHAEVVAAKPADATTGALAAGWRSEVAALEALEQAAATAAEVPGLERWAAAHRRYAAGTLAFVDEALPLLDAGDVDAYDQLYEATFDDDPFDLRADARAGAEEALGDGPLLALATVSERARIVTDQVVVVEMTVIRTLGSGA